MSWLEAENDIIWWSSVTLTGLSFFTPFSHPKNPRLTSQRRIPSCLYRWMIEPGECSSILSLGEWCHLCLRLVPPGSLFPPPLSLPNSACGCPPPRLLLSMHHLPLAEGLAEGASGSSKRVLGVTADGAMWIYHLVQYAQVLLNQPKHVQSSRPLSPEQRQAWDRWGRLWQETDYLTRLSLIHIGLD